MDHCAAALSAGRLLLTPTFSVEYHIPLVSVLDSLKLVARYHYGNALLSAYRMATFWLKALLTVHGTVAQ